MEFALAVSILSTKPDLISLQMTNLPEDRLPFPISTQPNIQLFNTYPESIT